MSSKPFRAEINEHTSKLIIGLIALSLAIFVRFISDKPLHSISASYHEGYWSRDIFVGCLFAVSAFLLSYNGKATHQRIQMLMSKIGAIAALGVALFPCKCVIHDEIIKGVHGLSTATMFLVLTVFCGFFAYSAWKKYKIFGYWRPLLRVSVYLLCASIMLTSILIIFIDHILDNAFSSEISTLIFNAEAAALMAFGIAWLTTSQFLPWITDEIERFSFFKRDIKELEID